ncbi:MAG: FHA domain-containing protein, partial [Blastocatellia bacterium]|nr:FHA domain-containing protein [Blastocatellia bacterium]
MPKARLIFDGREFYLGSGVATIGRAPDNSVSFPDDSNVSRNHVEIEQRGDYYCLVDLGSSNGTTVNGQRVEGEIYLWDGAKILLGGSAEVIVQFADESGDFA